MITLFTLVLAAASPDKPSWTCTEVRQFVATHGSAEEAEKAARSMGAPRWAIRLAKRCLQEARR